MNLAKMIIAGVFTVSSLGIATTAYAQTGVTCLDGSVENGDCIVRHGGANEGWTVARNTPNTGSDQQSSDDDDDDDDD